jgi:glycosyltransferase involved in cell wall biosynthesis
LIKVAAFTANKVDPSSRFRIRQFIEPLRSHGVDVREHHLPMTRYRRQPLASIALALRVPGVIASRSADISWFRRELIPERSTLERFTGGKRIFDVDDAIWLLSKSDFSERIVTKCDAVIAGNEFLADHYRSLGKPVYVVPTSIDTDLWKPPAAEPTEWFNIGWMGSRSNLRFLESIEQPLKAFLTDHRDAVLTVVCDDRPDLPSIPSDRWRFVRWTAEKEVEQTQRMDVGLMPLDDTDWSRGKCGFKMIQYMSVAKPVIVSPYGVNKEILDKGEPGYGAIHADDWYDGLDRLYRDRELAARLGNIGRRIVVENFSVRSNAVHLAKIFRQVIGPGTIC